MKITVKPELLVWARERAALEQGDLARRVGLVAKRVSAWEETGQIEFHHLQRLAEKTHTPIGYLFLEAPPRERLPVADFRSPGLGATPRVSADLLETLYACQERQAWFRDYLLANGEDRLPFVGSATIQERALDLAERIREFVGFDVKPNSAFSNWEDALLNLYARVEDGGILVMRNGVVGNNTHRKLSTREFRGFTLSDDYAPLIFVNAADSKSAQMFTVAHELAHVFLGESGVSDIDPRSAVPIERYCNSVAAEVLVPTAEFRGLWDDGVDVEEQVSALVKRFKVSALVLLIRARTAGVITQRTFEEYFDREYAEASTRERGGESGGDFYNTQGSRLGYRFMRAVLASTYEGKTPFTEAYRLLGVRTAKTFEGLAQKNGMVFG